jgi:hypothetical protein
LQLVTEMGDILEEPSFPLVTDKNKAPAAPASTAPLDPANHNPEKNAKSVIAAASSTNEQVRV